MSTASPTRRILIALTSHGTLGTTGRPTGYMVSEAAEPWATFSEAGYQVDLVSPQGGEPPRTGFDPDDPGQARFVAALHDQLTDTPRPDEVDPGRYDAIFFAGGHGTMWDFPADAGLLHLARSIYESGGVVSAVCHGPAALTELTLSDGSYLVAGKEVAAFSDDEEAAVGLTAVMPFLLSQRLAERGARLAPAPNFTARVATDGRLVTGQNPASAAGVASAVVGVLAGPGSTARAAAGADATTGS